MSLGGYRHFSHFSGKLHPNVESLQYVGPGGLGEARVKGMSIGEHCLLAGMDQQTKLEVG